MDSLNNIEEEDESAKTLTAICTIVQKEAKA